MNILYIHQYFLTRSDAGSARSYEYARYLADKGHRVTVITGSRNYQSGNTIEGYTGKLSFKKEIDGITVIYLKVLLSYRKSFLYRLLNFLTFMMLSTFAGLRAGKCDIILATSPPLTVGAPGYILSRVKRASFVFEVQDLWPEIPVALGALKNRPLIKLSEWSESFFYRKAVKIIAVTGGIYLRLLERGIPEGKIELVTQAADIDLFKPDNKSNSFREELGLKGEFVALYAGALYLISGLEIIIEAAGILQDERGIVFVLVGDGKDRERLIRLKESYSLENVLFVAPKPKAEIPKVMAAADVCLITAKNLLGADMICPNKLFDYLACGRPVLVNFPGEVKELLERTETGVFVEPGNPQAVAEAILALKNSPARCEQMGRNAREVAVRDYSRERLAAKLEQVLASCNPKKPEQ